MMCNWRQKKKLPLNQVTMSRTIGKTVLLFIFLIGNATCHSVVTTEQTNIDNRRQQSANYKDVNSHSLAETSVSQERTEELETSASVSYSTRTKHVKVLDNHNKLSGIDFRFGPGNHIRRTLLQSDGEVFQCGSQENLHQGEFSAYDYAIVCGMLVISLGIGVFYGFLHKSSLESSSSDFLLGSGMTVLPVTLSLTTSFITAIELLGNPSEMFYQGTQFSFIVFPMILVIPIAIKIFYPIYFKLELTSCYEYLGIRFGREIRMLGAFLYIIQMSFYTAVAVLAPAIALSKATGLNTRLAVILIYLVCIFYSSQGGMKAVVIADTFQACVLAVSLIIIVILGHIYTGNVWLVYETAAQNNRIELFNFDVNPTSRHTVWSVIIGGFFYWTSLFCTNQASVQKCMSLKSLKLAKVALGFAILGLIVVFLINFHTGLIVYTQYSSCDPLSFGRISATDQLLPYYVMDIFKDIKSISGIFVAGIFAASLGTVASALNSLSAVTCEDLLQSGFNKKIHPDKGATYAKWMSLGYGVLSFSLVFVVEHLGGVLQATLTLNGLIGGVTLGLFVLGIAFKRANTKGALYGSVIALCLVIYIGIMAQIVNHDPQPLPLSTTQCNCRSNSTVSSLYDESISNDMKFEAEKGGISSIYQLSYMWYSMIGTLLTIFFGYVISVVSEAVTKQRILKITRNQNSVENPEPVNGINIIVGQSSLQYVAQDQSQLHGIENMALRIVDEKLT